ncbi:MAG: CRISPR-associated CARF protein Csx1, partial [Candidatus Bathyarchaeota archaeon]|nr:CRISPR-associated CARF protein Csx1 [Candidatus Bathyarchaeota archaeon]
PVEYIYEGSSFEGRSTLPILLNNVSPKPDIIIAIVLDTTVNKIVSSYDELVKEVLLKYDSFSREIGLSENLVRFIVAPGAGRFQPIKDTFFNFIGELSDYRAYVMYELSKVLAKSDPGVTIHLDLTHGINFMPSLTLLAVREIASVIAFTRRSVRLKVYNAEPYIRNVTSRLNIHLVEDSPAIIEYDLMPLGAENKCVPLKRYGKSDICREKDLQMLISNCNRIKRNLNAFLSSVFNGLPLALYTFYPEESQLENIIEEIVEIWRENINVTSDGNEVYVKRNLSFGRDFTKLIQIWLIAKTLNLRRKIEVSYVELDNLRKVFSGFSKKADEMISRDLYRVRNDVEKKREYCRDWVKLCSIYRESKIFTERDFLAHSGLEMNVTEVKHDGQSIMLRYAKDKIGKVINGCLHGLLKVK